MKAEKRGLKGETRTQGRLTQPQIPIRLGSTYDFLAQALQKFVAKKKKIISRQFGIEIDQIKKKKRNRFKEPKQAENRKTNPSKLGFVNQYV